MNSSRKVARYLFGHISSVTFQILVLKKGARETSTPQNVSQSCLTRANIKTTWLGCDWFNRALCGLTDRRGIIEPITSWYRMVELLAHDLCNQVEAVDFPVYCFRYFGGHAAEDQKQIRTPSTWIWWISHTESVCTMKSFCPDWLTSLSFYEYWGRILNRWIKRGWGRGLLNDLGYYFRRMS